jgi:hypothetical protein
VRRGIWGHHTQFCLPTPGVPNEFGPAAGHDAHEIDALHSVGLGAVVVAALESVD